MIRVNNLVKQYGSFTAVNNISFEVSKGSIFGFVGPNGAGKTTTMRIMSTLLTATSGTIEIAGRPVSHNPREMRKLIGYMPDFFGVYDDLRVSEYLEFYGEASGCNLAQVRSSIPSLLELVGLEEKRSHFVNNLSRGMKQRLCLARTLVHQPEVLILDEPASGLDPRARVELRNILKELQRMGKTIVISSHILAELAQLCTHVGIITNGVMPVCGPISEILAQVSGEALLEITVLEDAEGARIWLLEQQGVREVHQANTGALEVFFEGDKQAQASLLRAAASRYLVASFIPRTSNLEEVFMQLTEVTGSADTN